MADASTVFAFAAQHSSPYAEVYQDGVSVGAYTAGDYTAPAYGTRFSVGSAVGGATWAYGVIEKIAIYNSVLNAGDVSAVSNLLAVG